MHSLPESNFINPAVQNDCKLFIGVPVLSSIHMHASNSGFTANQLLNKEPGGYTLDADGVLNRLAREKHSHLGIAYYHPGRGTPER